VPAVDLVVGGVLQDQVLFEQMARASRVAEPAQAGHVDVDPIAHGEPPGAKVPRQRQVGKGAKGGRILEMEGQLLVTQLPPLLGSPS
jgi:hypothetical protein